MICKLLSSTGLISTAKTRAHQHFQKLKPRAMDFSKIEVRKIESRIALKLEVRRIVVEILCLRKINQIILTLTVLLLRVELGQ